MITATLQNNLAPKMQAALQAAQNGLKAGAAAGAQVFEAHAKENAPVLTGRLRDGIHTETVTDSETVQTLMVTPVVAASNKYGFEPPYARRIELGFIGVDSLGRHYHQAPEPYMRPAFDEGLADATTALTGAVKSAVKEVA
jgi:Bacteriophage HK97-gp10, putative tail-component